MKKISARQLTTAAAIAALYTVLSLASSFIPTVGGVFQFRVSEALTILPYFTPAAIPGLFIGCLLSNLITGALPYDLVFGSLATLIGAIGTFALRKLGKNTSRTLPGGMPLGAWLAPLPPIAANTIIMPFVIAKISETPESIPLFAFSVFVGEIVCCGGLGLLLLAALKNLRRIRTVRPRLNIFCIICKKSLQTVHIRVYNDSASGMLLHRREFVVEIISTDISGENYEKGHPSFLRRKHRPLRMR